MSEAQMYWAALAFDWGVPLITAAVLVRRPRLRRYATVVLGALTPALVFYACVTIAYAFNPKDTDNIFAFYAMGVMTFFLYVVLFVAGLLLGLLPKPSNLYVRYALGLFVAPPLCYLINKVPWFW